MRNIACNATRNASSGFVMIIAELSGRRAIRTAARASSCECSRYGSRCAAESLSVPRRTGRNQAQQSTKAPPQGSGPSSLRSSFEELVVRLVVVRRARDHFVGHVVTMLLRVEEAPAALEEVRKLGAEDPSLAGIAVGDGRAGDLVVLVVLPEASIRRVERGRGITALREPPKGLIRGIRVVLVGVEDEA